ncbi:MAG: HAMP domain-containing protein, partial [Acidobacteria bacterium]|nr:HAMP domain-containing protein [Acidobacteriota bacterium]
MSHDDQSTTTEALAQRPSPADNGGEAAHRHGRRIGVAAQLYLLLLGSVLLTLSASLVGYFSFQEIIRYGSRLTEFSIPNLSSAVDAARQSAVVVNGAIRLSSASSLQEHGTVAQELAREQSALGILIQELASQTAFGEQTRLIEGHLAELSVHLELIQESAARRLVINQTLEDLTQELAETNRRIEQSIVTLIDDQEFYLVEGMRRLQDQPSPITERASEAELTYARDLTTLNHQANLATLLLGNALALSDRGLLPPLRERFRSAVQNFRRAYERLAARNPDNLLRTELERLARIGEADEGILPLREETLRRLEQEQTALAKGREASAMLLAEVNTLVEEINDEAVDSSTAAQSAAQTGRLLLGVLNVLSISGALLLGWLFVGRYMIRRLVGLATAMRSMAGGDLEVPVEVKGNDEVTDMANALEVFRRHALEVQRLNLVEKLAKELDAKNHTLEQTLEQLEEAQEQIIAEKKLSSLGQLTAGVAHEIKNPLNFVSNFSEVSVELVDEIGEVMEEAKTGEVEMSEEIIPILSDLKLNLQKVKEHSQRA